MNQMGATEMEPEWDSRPLYNIKAVAKATGLSPATLRAWERRYGALSPSRTESGYRLYSLRDVTLLRWLKARIDEGVNISQAIALAAHHELMRSQASAPAVPETRAEAGTELDTTRQELLAALLAFDEAAADRVCATALAAYGVEIAAEHILMPVIVQVNDGRTPGTIFPATVHFATHYLHRKLDALINAIPHREDGPTVVLGCAPDDWHDLELTLLHLLLRRRGLTVLYLGQSVPVEEFVIAMRRVRPAGVIFTASTEDAAIKLAALAHQVQKMPDPRPWFSYGGPIFAARPDLRAAVPGIALEGTARQAADQISALLMRQPSVFREEDH